MLTRCKLLGLLTSFQAESLKKLADLHSRHPGQYWRPRDIGAFRGSHHNKTLQSLFLRGLVAREPLGEGEARPVYAYKVTPSGLTVLQTFRELAGVPLEAIMGGAHERRSATIARQIAYA